MLLEAVPNLSMGPDAPFAQAILDAVRRAQGPGVALLDVHTDVDHARTVLTLAGAPAPLTRTLNALVTACDEHGSLSGHEGVHPRTGFLDVLPLIPLHQARWQDAERTARHAAARVAGRGIPVHLYGRLATRPEHTVLHPIRARHRAHTAGTQEHPPSDLGPDAPHKRLGCTCVGVRELLVAYNVVLDTDDREIGDTIACNVRERSPGGLPGVQSLAFPLASRGGVVQVSCNLTEPSTTGPADVYQRVHALAAEHGVGVVEGELVGLCPEDALPEDPALMGLDKRPMSLEEHLARRGLPPYREPSTTRLKGLRPQG